jgi:mannose-6-phosphate isomerase-like protein (cupin superfamily)
MPKPLRWFIVATIAVTGVFAAWVKHNGRLQSVSAHDAIYQAKAQAAPTTPDDSRVIFFSAKQLDSEVHRLPEVGPSTFRVDLNEYSAAKGGASVMRRTKPYRAEVHKQLVDMWYVIRGEGTLVTGGSLSEPTETEPDEFRGPSIAGGEERHIAQDDFVRIPAASSMMVRIKSSDSDCPALVRSLADRPFSRSFD